MANLNVAILGYGLAGSVFHAPLVATTSGLQISHILTNSAERKRQASKDHPNAQIISSAEELWLGGAKCDLVVIASPNKYHGPLAMRAIEHGIPVVIDKPMAATLEEARRVVALSEKQGVLLSVFQNRRWDNDFLTVKKILAEDTIGKPLRFESRFERWRPKPKENAWRESGDPKEAGGLLFDLGSHLIDQAIHLFGRPIKAYCESNLRRAGAQADDDTFVSLTFENGVIAHLWMNVTSCIQGPRFRVSGLKGSYEKYGLDPQEASLRAGITPKDKDFGVEDPSMWGRLKTDFDGAHYDDKFETLSGQYQMYYSLVRDAVLNMTPPPVDPREVLMTMEVIDRFSKQARS